MRTKKLVDISFWQASDRRHPPVIPMDWSLAAAQGVDGAYIKASEALSKDPELERNHAGAGKQRIKRGTYHFFRSYVPGIVQAEHFLGVTEGVPWEQPPALDVEVECYAKELWLYVKRIHAEAATRSTAPIWPLIYTGPWAWSRVKDGYTIAGLRVTTYKTLIAEHCDLWQAQYPLPEYDDGQRVVALDPIQPWAKLGKRPVIHQYSARNKLGRLYGSKGSFAIDLDLADEAWFAQWPVPGEQQSEPEPGEYELNTRFQALVEGQVVRSEPSTAKGSQTVTGKLAKGQVLHPARDISIKGPGEVWIKFDAGWVAAVHGGTMYLKAQE